MSSTAVPAHRAIPRLSNPLAKRIAARAAAPTLKRARRERLRAAIGPATVRTDAAREYTRLRSTVKKRSQSPASTTPLTIVTTGDSATPAAGSLSTSAPRSSLGDDEGDNGDDEPAGHRGPYYAFALLSAERRGAQVEAVVA